MKNGVKIDIFSGPTDSYDCTYFMNKYWCSTIWQPDTEALSRNCTHVNIFIAEIYVRCDSSLKNA